jgi:hypothetical protein
MLELVKQDEDGKRLKRKAETINPVHCQFLFSRPDICCTKYVQTECNCPENGIEKKKYSEHDKQQMQRREREPRWLVGRNVYCFEVFFYNCFCCEAEGLEGRKKGLMWEEGKGKKARNLSETSPGNRKEKSRAEWE